MGLTYHFKFRAPSEKSAKELEAFLRTVEVEAERLGFGPTMVLNATFDTVERQEFARRLTHGFILESEALKSVTLRAGQVWHFDSADGSCRVIPEQGVVLVITDEQRCETIFGFFKYPASLKGMDGEDVVPTSAGEFWTFEDFVKTSDPRFRALVKKFAEAGYVEAEQDDYKVVSQP